MEMNSIVHAELLTLREGLLVTAALCWAESHGFTFESDSKVVVSWFSNTNEMPW